MINVPHPRRVHGGAVDLTGTEPRDYAYIASLMASPAGHDNRALGVSLRQNPEIEKAELKNELLLLNSTSNKFYVMNATAAVIWETLEHPAAEQDLVTAICSRFQGITPDEALKDVQETVKSMRDLGLILE